MAHCPSPGRLRDSARRSLHPNTLARPKSRVAVGRSLRDQPTAGICNRFAVKGNEFLSLPRRGCIAQPWVDRGRVAPASCPAGALSDPDKEISTIRLFCGPRLAARPCRYLLQLRGQISPSQSSGCCFPAEVRVPTGPPLLDRLRGKKPRYPASTLVCSPPTPLLLRPTLRLPLVAGLPRRERWL